MTKEIIIDINQTGKTEALHFDEFPLSFLGDLAIGRASEIFFNEREQNWEVILPGSTFAVESARGFSSYNGARNFEVEWLQGCKKENVHPESLAGIRIADSLRDCETVRSI